MTYPKKRCQPGQGLTEYAIILALVAIVTIAALSLLGSGIGNTFLALPFIEKEGSNTILSITDDFLSRIREFYDENGKWPRSWGDYAFTDIGLDPDDWDDPIEGLYWKPHGKDVGLANRPGDDVEVYVDDLDGNTLHLYNGWSIWCQTNNKCYYHSVAPENEIDASTIVVIKD